MIHIYTFLTNILILDIDELIEFSIKMMQDDNTKLQLERLEKELAQMELEELEFSEYCAEMSADLD